MTRFDLSQEEITDGSVLRALLLLSVPLFAQNLVRVAQQVIDLFWIGRYSSDGVAAIGLASPVVWLLLTSATSATFVGTQVLVSQRVGADNARGAKRMAFTGVLLTVFFCLVVGVSVFLNVDALLDTLFDVRVEEADSEVRKFAVQYLQVISLGIIFAGLSDVIEAIFLGWGNSRATLYMNVVSVAVNVGLDPLFIFGVGPIPAMGIRGAAMATVAGYVAGFTLGVTFVARQRTDRVLSWDGAEIDVGDVKKLLDVGLPKAVQDAAGTSSRLVLVILVFATGGSAGLAAYTVGSRVSSLAFRSVMSLNTATQSIVGQNLGADNPERATRVTWLGVTVSVVLLSLVALVQWSIPGTITRVFVPNIEGTAFAYAQTYLTVFAVAYPAKGVFSVIKAGFNGAQRTKLTMVASLGQSWGLQIPIAFVAGMVLSYGVIGVFWAQTLSVIVAAVCLGVYYRHTTDDGMYDRAARRASVATDD